MPRITKGWPFHPMYCEAKSDMAKLKMNLERPLNVRQLAFIREYAVTGNGRHSAVMAGYSPHSAEVLASKLLAQPKIKSELMKLRSEISDRFSLKAAQVLQQLARMVMVDPREFVYADGKPVPLHQLSDAAASALQGFETEVLGGGITRTKYKLVDRGAAVERAMRHLGLFEQDNKQGASQVAVLMAEIYGAGSRIPVKP